jgi:hypothetical protein
VSITHLRAKRDNISLSFVIAESTTLHKRTVCHLIARS